MEVEVEVEVGHETGDDDDADEVVVEGVDNDGAVFLSPVIGFKAEEFVAIDEVRRDVVVVVDDDDRKGESDVLLLLAVTAGLEA
jgi:hypothetical protein